MRARGRRIAAAARDATAVLGSAGLFAAAFPPWRLWPLAFVALVPLFLTVRRGGLGRSLAATWCWTMAMAWLLGDWLPRAVVAYYGQPWFVGALFFFGVSTVTAGLYYMAFTAAYRRLVRSSSPVLPALAAAAWTAAELGRGRLMTGTMVVIANPWALLGYSQVGAGPHVQVASLAGVYGLGFLAAFSNAALAELWVSRGSRRAAVWVLAAALTFLFAAGWGVLAVPRPDAAASGVRVAIVQPNVDLGSQWSEAHRGRNLRLHLRLTERAIARARPAVVVWPENALSFHVDREPAYRLAIRRVVEPADVELIAGGPRAVRRAPGSPFDYRNAVFLLDPRGDVRGLYDKQYLVPFAEYFPFGLDLVRRSAAGPREFQPGPTPALLPTRLGLAGIVTCNEAMLPEVVGARVAAGAELLVNPANDTWLDDRKYSMLVMDIVALRAVEQRRPLLRASTSGPSALVDPWGRVLTASEPLSRAVVAGRIAGRTGRTVYGRIGDAFALLCAAATLLALLAPARREGAARAGDRPRLADDPGLA